MRRRRHRSTCRHCPRVRELGRDFQAWRASWEVQLEAAACGYAEEGRQYREQRPAPTFRSYLTQMAGSGWPMSGSHA